MNWKEYYKQHLMSAEDAVNHIQSGNRVVVAHMFIWWHSEKRED